jgi:hypothetical protein
VLLLSYDDGAGLNLQHGCHHVVLYAPLALAAKDSEKIIAAVGKEQQSIGRVRRSGQQHKVTVHSSCWRVPAASAPWMGCRTTGTRMRDSSAARPT